MKWSTNWRKVAPVSDWLRHGAQTTYLSPILAKWANISPESDSQNTNQARLHRPPHVALKANRRRKRSLSCEELRKLVIGPASRRNAHR